MSEPTFGPSEIYLGWQHALVHPDPGLPPRRPRPAEPERLDPAWLAAQRRESRRLSLPARCGAIGGVALAGVAAWLGVVGVLAAALSGLSAVAGAALTWRCGWVVGRDRRRLRVTVTAEKRRVAAARGAREAGHEAALAEHARRYRVWEEMNRHFSAQPQWYPVRVGGHIDRVDVVGGTHAGWSALLTTLAVPRLESEGEVTVIDLSEGAVARDLVSVASGAGVRPLVWVLPEDLPAFDLGAGLPAAGLADVLAASAATRSGGDPDAIARDHALLTRVCEVFGDGVTIARVTAALRVLGQVGDPHEDIARGLLTSAQLERLTSMFGRAAAERVVIERAWAVEARLRVLDQLGTAPRDLPRSRLRVVATDRAAGAFGNGVLGTYVVLALAHLLRQSRPNRPWWHTICLAGADRLDGEVLDQLSGVCETTRTGLVLASGTVPEHVKRRLGRGNAALAVMRLGNAEDAKTVSEQIGTEHRFVISQFTDTVGASVTDSLADSYTHTVGTADSVSDSDSVGTTTGRSSGRSRSHTGAAPLAPRTASRSGDVSESRALTRSTSLTEGINDSTSWGLTTSRAVGTNDSTAQTWQRSREFLVEPHELQRLPASAVIVSYAGPEGRQAVLADANPAILTLPTTTLMSVAEFRQADRDEPAAPARQPPPRTAVPRSAAPRVSVPRPAPAEPPPNLGPPPRPLDWRARRGG